MGFRGLVLGEQKIIHARMLPCDWQANLGKEARTPDTFLWAERIFFFFKFCVVRMKPRAFAYDRQMLPELHMQQGELDQNTEWKEYVI